MYALVLTIHVLVSLFLIFIILIQSSKGEGLSDVFGGGSSQTTIFGTRTGTFLTKATTVSAVIFMLTCLSLAIMSRGGKTSVMQRELYRRQIEEKLKDVPQKNDSAQTTPADVPVDGTTASPDAPSVPAEAAKQPVAPTGAVSQQTAPAASAPAAASSADPAGSTPVPAAAK